MEQANSTRHFDGPGKGMAVSYMRVKNFLAGEPISFDIDSLTAGDRHPTHCSC